ncbi:hypothetical protein LXL04_008778 [Taraxacum kok-saghyz]
MVSCGHLPHERLTLVILKQRLRKRSEIEKSARFESISGLACLVAECKKEVTMDELFGWWCGVWHELCKFEPFVLAMQPTQVCFMPYLSLKQNNTDWMDVFKVKPRGWTDVGESDRQKDVAFQEDEVIASEIISNTTEAFEYDDNSSNGSDDDITNDVEGDFDDANNSGDDGFADSEGSFEFSTSDNEEEVEEED